MGLVAALAAILLVHLTCSGREPVASRVIAAAAALPGVAATLVLTFSRAGVARGDPRAARLRARGAPARAPQRACVAVARSRRSPRRAAYGAETVAPGRLRGRTASRRARRRHRRCSLCATSRRRSRGRARGRPRPAARPGRGSRRCGGSASRRPPRGPAAWFSWSCRLRRGPAGEDRRTSTTGSSRATRARRSETRDRLTDVSNGGRVEQWDIALDGWSTASAPRPRRRHVPARVLPRRRPAGRVTDGHSLYLEALDELGVVGLLLLAAALLAIVLALVRGLRRHRSQAGALLAATRRGSSPPGSTGTGRCRW